MSKENTPQEEGIVESLSTNSTFKELIDNANLIQNASKDFLIESPSTQFRMRPDLRLSSKTWEKDTAFQLTDHALSQLCTKLEMPVRYMKKCLKDKEPDLFEDNMNTWLSRYDKPLLVRTHEDHIRGVLSSRYSMFDTPEILSVLSETSDTLDVKGSYISPERFHARLVDRTRLPVENEDLFWGVQTDSSDVGRRTITVRFMVFKQVCTNGLILPVSDFTIFSQKHMGLSLPEFQEAFRMNMSKVGEMKESVIRLITESKDKKLTKKELETLLENVQNRANLPKDSGEKIIDFMTSKYEMNRFGLVNSLTDLAQEFTLDRRIALEEVAGSLLLKVA